MAIDLGQRILEREIASTLSRRRTIRDLYGHRSLVQELDIVNELDGHTGCVNALSWSKSGRLLASGSDDQHLNIHVYQPESSDKQFQLQTTVATGHTQNIFSVKFMPQSNDRTVVTCAGDGDVRVFDLEHAGTSTDASAAANRASTRRRARRANSHNGIRYMTDGDTNARIYRSHGDRVKRIVTESSPYLFLTCSEDGEVRQWDTRQPSEAYPRPRNGHSGVDTNVPPPLISYSGYNLDLNTISCSASQPHYIALGGAHLHCFLHDRRMTGRDRHKESGRPSRKPRTRRDDELMNEATRCVRKFAPQGQQRMGADNRGHITACKISDARPNEMIVSWSGDHIYAFDLVHSPDADEAISSSGESPRDLKRKRTLKSSNSQEEVNAIRIRYGNGQQEDIMVQDDPETDLSVNQQRAQVLTREIFKIRELLTNNGESEDEQKAKYTTVIELCETALDSLDEVLREWTYPLEPSQHELARQNKMREIRERARRCIQVAGIISRLVLGTAMPAFNRITGEELNITNFIKLDNRMNDLPLQARDKYLFDFAKAICAWLDAGIGNLVSVFSRPAQISPHSKLAARLPIPQDEDGSEGVEILISYLLEQLSIFDGPRILDPEANRFEMEENRQIFANGVEAVMMFKSAIQQGFADLMSSDDDTPGIVRQDAIEFWAFRVARSLLLQAFQDLAHLEISLGGIKTITEESMGGQEIDSAAAMANNGSAPFVVGTGDSESRSDVDDRENENVIEYEEADEDDSSEPDEEDGVPNIGLPRFMRSAAERRRRRNSVAADIPCNGAINTYRGHCNVRTVKDVNYFGLEDEYVVSGSDDGNLFIWESKSGQLVNILEGDGEVVNVVQGHPYETMLAVSGIDDTIKIFSPDHHAREVARLGQGVTAHDSTSFSSIGFGRRSRGARQSQTFGNDIEQMTVDDDDYVAETGLRSRRRMQAAQQIIDHNDMGRRRGDDDAVITTTMLRRLAQRMRAQRAASGGNPNIPLDDLDVEEDEHGRVRVVLSDDCVLM